jgi:hypothetical protein
MRIVHHFHLATLLIVLMFGAVYAQSSTFEQEAISDRARLLAEELKLSSIDPILRKKTGLK